MTRDAELAWAAGIFEGEGTVARKRGKGTLMQRLISELELLRHRLKMRAGGAS
jgi:hypothetical protein